MPPFLNAPIAHQTKKQLVSRFSQTRHFIHRSHHYSCISRFPPLLPRTSSPSPSPPPLTLKHSFPEAPVYLNKESQGHSTKRAPSPSHRLHDHLPRSLAPHSISVLPLLLALPHSLTHTHRQLFAPLRVSVSVSFRFPRSLFSLFLLCVVVNLTSTLPFLLACSCTRRSSAATPKPSLSLSTHC